MTRRKLLQSLFFGAALAIGITPKAAATTYQFTASANGSVQSQTAIRLKINTRSFPGLGLMVVALNYIGGNWVFTVNGKSVICAASDKAVVKGDIIRWQTV